MTPFATLEKPGIIAAASGKLEAPVLPHMRRLNRLASSPTIGYLEPWRMQGAVRPGPRVRSLCPVL